MILRIFLLFSIAFTLTLCRSALACSMCKVTFNGKTYLGNNEDSWQIGSRIRFVNAPPGKLGALYVSYQDLFAQGGMNEAGLAFDGLTIYKPNIKVDSTKQNVTDFRAFVSDIMQNCKTVEDVRKYAVQFNRNKISNGELFFADKTGHYLIMEPDTMILGNDDKYIIANFCPSITPEKDRLDWDRYRRGREYINRHHSDTTSNYCLALVDTMHECREKMGEGTMYSSIADLENADYSLYFYHDYTREVKFNLKKELAKGDHTIEIASLFPKNAEYEKLASYKVPQNDRRLFQFLLLCGTLFGFSGMYFLISYLNSLRLSSRIRDPNDIFKLLLFLISISMLYYMYALVRNPAIFYSKAPYRHFQFSMLDIVAYLPFILLVLIGPFLKLNIKIFGKNTWWLSSKLLLTLNNLVCLTLISFFFYWGFYDVF
ncbi:MAG: hypothetical protein ABIN80_11155 [Dyadobacter sp.]